MKTLKLVVLLVLAALGASAQKVEVRWMTIEEALKASEKMPKKILIDIYTDWCSWCKVMDRQTFSDSAIASYINQNFYAVKLNAEKQPTFSYKGQDFRLLSAGGKSMNEFVLAITNNQPSYPSIAYLDEQGNLLTVIPGFKKPDALSPILKFLNEDKYKSITFEQYMKEYGSK